MQGKKLTLGVDTVLSDVDSENRQHRHLRDQRRQLLLGGGCGGRLRGRVGHGGENKRVEEHGPEDGSR
jgi:hypothetical protein